MAVIGELIKKAIELSGYIMSDPDPVKEQREILKTLLEKARLTAFGKAYHFSEILESQDIISSFQKKHVLLLPKPIFIWMCPAAIIARLSW